MRLTLDNGSGGNLIRSYASGEVKINDECYRNSVIVCPGQPVAAWRPRTFAELHARDLEALLAYGPELVLLGTGADQRFPAPALTAVLGTRGVGLEAMSTAAACRTYNIVMAEGRRVVAALLLA